MDISKLKIIHYNTIWLPQTQTWLYTLIREQNKFLDAHILCEKTELLDQFSLPRIHTLSGRFGLRYQIESSLRNARIIKMLPCMNPALSSLKPTLIHSHFGNIGWMNRSLSETHGIPHVVSFYGADASLLPTIKPVWKERYKQLFKLCSSVLVEGPHMAKKIASFGCSEKKIVIQKIGVLTKNISFVPRKWKKGDTFRILIAASFRQKKGIPAALKAIGMIKKELPLEIILIGDAVNDYESINEKRDIFRCLQQSGLLEVTQHLGFVPHEKIFQIAETCHLFLHTSQRAENGDDEGGSPVILTEMAANGMPIVSTFHCDIPDVILHTKSGYLARENDVDDISFQIRRWTSDPESWHTKLCAGREHIDKNYNIETQAMKMLDIYSKLCGR